MLFRKALFLGMFYLFWVTLAFAEPEAINKENAQQNLTQVENKNIPHNTNNLQELINDTPRIKIQIEPQENSIIEAEIIEQKPLEQGLNNQAQPQDIMLTPIEPKTNTTIAPKVYIIEEPKKEIVQKPAEVQPVITKQETIEQPVKTTENLPSIEAKENTTIAPKVNIIEEPKKEIVQKPAEVQPVITKQETIEQPVKTTENLPSIEAKENTTIAPKVNIIEEPKKEIVQKPAEVQPAVTKQETIEQPVKTTENLPTGGDPQNPSHASLSTHTRDLIGLKNFGPDGKPDTCIEMLAVNKSPIIAARLESYRGSYSSWKTKDGKVQAQGVLALLKEQDKLINPDDMSFVLDVTKPITLSVCVQDTGIINNKNNSIRIILYHKDGTRSYAVLQQ